MRASIFVAILALSLFVGPVYSAEYPSRTIRIIVPYPAGGSTDIMARMLAQNMSGRMGQPVIVENKSGAGGTIGTAFVASAEPSGYVLLFGNSGPISMGPSIYKNLPYDTRRDFAPISPFASTPLMLAVPATTGVQSLKELIAQDHLLPGKLNFASAGVGSISHVLGEFFNIRAGTRFVHVPYQGIAAAVKGVLAGEVSMLFVPLFDAAPHAKSGAFRIIGVSAKERSSLVPETPTLVEAGLPEFDATVWFGLLSPAGTPKHVVRWLNEEVRQAVMDSEVRTRLANLAATVAYTSPETFSAMIEVEIALWAEVVRKANIKPQ